MIFNKKTGWFGIAVLNSVAPVIEPIWYIMPEGILSFKVSLVIKNGEGL